MSLINASLRWLFDTLLYPFRDLSPVVSLVPLSVVTAIALLLIFKKTSNQAALEAVKRRILAGVFEIRLFNDDLGFIFRAQAAILRQTLTYMRYSLPPMLWTLPPLVLLIAHLQFYYGYQGLEPGSATVVHVELNENRAEVAKPAIEIEAPSGLMVASPPVWIPALREMAWRVEVQASGDYTLQITAGTETVAKTLHVGDSVVRRSPIRVTGLLSELIYPAESPLPRDGAFRSIRVDYPETTVSVFGWGIHWMIVFFALSMVFALLLRKPFGVTL